MRHTRPWRTFAVLTVRTALPAERTASPGFDPYAHSLPRLAPGAALAGARSAAYRGSRTGRRGRRSDRNRRLGRGSPAGG
ncbi:MULTISPECIES: hypothetical protein [unclassified Streptomyces]|uniref:hypothetical protein n=1 Tax=unclassified Streptomyces TaxID=2593676 RepID=UPI003D75F32D